MNIFDLHQDLMLHIVSRKKYNQNEQTSWGMLEDSPVDLVVATAFPDPESGDQRDASVLELIDVDIQKYTTYIAQHTHTWVMVTDSTHLSDKRKKLLLHIEGLNVFSASDEHWQRLAAWYDAGVRSVGMWWNIDNALGGGTDTPEKPLSPLGEAVMSWIENKGIVLDLAHAGRKTFEDVAKLSTRPLYVSHGAVDSLCPSVRNYTDEQLRLIAESGGVFGLFFSNKFTVGERKGSIDDLIAHILYVKKLLGIDHLALGSDFGGIITGTLDRLSSVKDFQVLIHALYSAGLSEDEVSAICYKNADRVLRSHLS